MIRRGTGSIAAHTATNVLVYGCLLYNNGRASPDNAEGHGIYVQGDVGTKTMADNIIFNNSGVNMHVYENAPGETLVGITLDGNVAFNASAIQRRDPTGIGLWVWICRQSMLTTLC